MQAQELAAKLCDWLQEQLIQRNSRGFVVGLSGGIDSAVTAALCKRARPEHTLGIIMPCRSNPQDEQDALLAARAFDITVEKIILDEPFDLLVKKLTGEPYNPGKRDLPVANIKPRLRMITLYFFAARNQYLVAGTGNLSELTVGYFTKYGDGGVDLLPIGNLVKSQVRELAGYLGVPREVIDKSPSAGLWSGQNDEIEMGITYRELDEYILTGQADKKVREVVTDLAIRNAHKKEMPALPPF